MKNYFSIKLANNMALWNVWKHQSDGSSALPFLSFATVPNCVAFVTLFSKMWVCTNYEIRKRVQLGSWLLMATVRIWDPQGIQGTRCCSFNVVPKQYGKGLVQISGTNLRNYGVIILKPHPHDSMTDLETAYITRQGWYFPEHSWELTRPPV